MSTGLSKADAATSSTEVVIEAGVASNAHSANIAPDNGIVLAGDNWATRSAWAVRTDWEGHPQWRIDIPSEDPQRTSASGSKFNSSTILQDGTTVLCGHIGVQRVAPQPAFLVLVSADGIKLKEKRLFPSGNEAFRVNDILKCIARNGGIITIGRAIKYRPINVMPRIDYFYWIAFHDTSGELKWERTLPIGIERLEQIDSITATSDGHIVFCGEGANQAEFVSIGIDGAVSARLTLPGRYLLVQTAVDKEAVQILSRTIGKPWELLTLDSQLRVLHRTVSGRTLDTDVSAAWATTAEDILVFGEAIRDSVPKEATVVEANRALQSFSTLNVPSLADSHFIDAVAYSHTDRKFVMAHVYYRPNKSDSPIGTSLTFLQNN
ncbi:hypothetical protein [Paraburkholderia sp. GAS334]|uniref:hypothetical protein n=1 Tax=Paraburkholderia sp. GAS334 TaxID=3035131 RepID=UPI003D1F7E07